MQDGERLDISEENSNKLYKTHRFQDMVGLTRWECECGAVVEYYSRNSGAVRLSVDSDNDNFPACKFSKEDWDVKDVLE